MAKRPRRHLPGRAGGRFITFEGGEGSGKSTQALLLAKRLEAEGYPFVLTREPAGTDLGRWLLRLLAEKGPPLDPMAELLLFEAARAQHVAEVVRPALERGDTVICDRFTDSTLAYQGCGRGLDLGLIRTLNDAATAGLTPDLTVLLDISPPVGLARKDHEKISDSIGAEAVEFHRRVREGYLALASSQGGSASGGNQERQRFLVLDASLPREELSEAIWNACRLFP